MNRFLIAALVAVLATPGVAQTINNLGAGSAVSGNDLFPAYQGANPAKKVTATQIKTFVGGVTSISAGCGASTGGSPITTSGTIKGIATRNAQTGTSYAILDADCANVVTFSNASAVAVSIAQAGTGGNFAAGWFATLINQGVGTVTITPTTSTIDGSANLTLATNQSVDIFTDGTNYFTARGRGSATPGGSSGQLQTNNGSGGFGAVAAPSGAVVGTTDTQTLTNKSISGAQINSGTIDVARLPSSVVNHPGYGSTAWYATSRVQSAQSSTTPVITAAYCAIFQMGGNSSVSVSSLGIRTTANGGNIQLAIYTNQVTTLGSRPNAIVGATGNIVATTAGNLSGALSGGPFAVAPGFYWGCITTDNTSIRWLSPVTSTQDPSAVYFQGATSLAGTVSASLVNGTSATGLTFGTWPATMTSSESTNFGPSMAFQVQ